MYLTLPDGDDSGRGGTSVFLPAAPTATVAQQVLARRLAAQAGDVLERLDDGRRHRTDEVVEVLRLAVALAEFVLDAEPAVALEAVHDPDEYAMFRREGAMWHVAFAGRAVRLRDSLGLVYLGRLLSRPGERTHSLMLAAHGDPGAAVTVLLRDVSGTPNWDRNLALLNGLNMDLEDAVRVRDNGRTAALRGRIDTATEELLRTLGAGRRSPELRRAIERSRLNVSRAIAAALVRIARHHPPLGKHLQSAIRLGTFCVYLPDPRLPIRWES